MTRADLRTLISTWTDDMSQTYFTAAQVNVWLNLAQRQVQMMLLQAGQNWYMKPVETLTVANQADYVLPNDFIMEHRIELVLSGTGDQEARRPIAMITTNQQDFVPIAPGTPRAYAIKKNRITLSPTPDTSNLVLRLYYSPRVTDMSSDSDSPDVPEQFMEYVALLAAYDAFIKDDRDPSNIIAKKAKYEELLKEMAAQRTQDAPRMVVISDEYDRGDYF